MCHACEIRDTGLPKPDLNIPLLRKMVEWVEAQELLHEDVREWRQHVWLEDTSYNPDCGTKYCIAGKIALDAGWEPFWYEGGTETWEVQKDGEIIPVSHAAMRELGIPYAPGSTSSILFDAHNSAAKVRMYAEMIAGERL